MVCLPFNMYFSSHFFPRPVIVVTSIHSETKHQKGGGKIPALRNAYSLGGFSPSLMQKPGSGALVRLALV